MSWPNFDGKPYTRDQLAARIAACDFAQWKRKDGSRGKPAFVTLHNTSEPTIKTWLSWSSDKRQQYIHNMQPYYENMGWRGGPHFFVPPQGDICAFGFNDLAAAGTHASCFNNASIGIEMVGEFDRESFSDGPGALVADNAIVLMALLHNKIGIAPEPYLYGVKGLHFHVECKRDNHDCPGKDVHKDDVVARVKAKMAELSGHPSPAPIIGPPPLISRPSAPALQMNITATVFGGATDRESDAYDGHIISADPGELGCALPFHFPPPLPRVRVINAADTSRTVIVRIEDVGPWNTDNPYWLTGARPQAETGTDTRGRKTNRAGIDLTPAAARAIGIDGKGVVHWEFVA